jgi:hypothetical protein
MDLRFLGYFWLYGPVVPSLNNSRNTQPRGAILSTSVKFLQHFAAITSLPLPVVVVTPCAPHWCCQTDLTPDRDWLRSVFRAGSPGFFQKERPRGYYLPEPTLEGCSFVKSCLMVTHQKPDSESGVHNSSMAYGALTVPASSCSMCAVAGSEGCSSASGLRSATTERGWR